MTQTISMPLEAARGCSEFAKSMIKKSKESSDMERMTGLPSEKLAEFDKSLEDLISYLDLMVSSEIEEIEIPQHHMRMFIAVCETGMLASPLVALEAMLEQKVKRSNSVGIAGKGMQAQILNSLEELIDVLGNASKSNRGQERKDN